jgi:hypothetical protein
MAKAKTPRTTKSTTSKSRTGKNLLQMPESGNGVNGNGSSTVPQYSPADLEADIRIRAYELYEQRGCIPGQDEQDWFTAEREILSRHDSHKHTA